MIKANHTYLGCKVCAFYSDYKLDKAFQSVRYLGDYTDTGHPTLMIANHFSWWDGFIQNRINNHYYKRKFHVMMLEEQLVKYKILNKGGAFSIRKQSRDMVHSLNYCIDLLQHPKNLVLIFPQGRIESIYTPEFRFEHGLDYLFKRIGNDFQFIFNINLTDYFSDRKPTLSIYVKPFLFPTGNCLVVETIEKAFNEFYHTCKLQQQP